MPERKRTVTPTMFQTLEKNGACGMERKIGKGARRLRKRIVLQTPKLRWPTSNYGAQKKEAKCAQVRGRGTERKLSMSPGDKSRTGYGFEKKLKFALKGDVKEFANEK